MMYGGDFLGPPDGTTPAAVKANKNKAEKVQVGKDQEKAQSEKDSKTEMGKN